MKFVKMFFYLLSAIIGFGIVLLGWLIVSLGDLVVDLYKSSAEFWVEIVEDLKYMK